MSCELEFKKLFEEPDESYICISTVLFLPKGYFRHLQGQLKDIKDEKKSLFLKNLIQIAKIVFERKNYYLRIYFNSALLQDPDYLKMITAFRKHPKIQLVNYKDPAIELCTEHYGTLVRIHPLFEPNNIRLVCLMDADNYYTDVLFDEIEKFDKSNHDILAVTRGISCGNMYNIQPRTVYELNKEIFNNHFLYGATMFKVNEQKFTKDIWNNYFLNIYGNVGLKHVLMESDYKKFSYFPDTEEVSYLSYQYGTDEIILNYLLKYIIKDLDIKYLYFRDENMMNYMLSRIILSLKFNKKRNRYAAKKIPSLDKNDIRGSFQTLKDNIKYLKMIDIDVCFIKFIEDYERWLKITKEGHSLDYYLGQL